MRTSKALLAVGLLLIGACSPTSAAGPTPRGVAGASSFSGSGAAPLEQDSVTKRFNEVAAKLEHGLCKLLETRNRRCDPNSQAVLHQDLAKVLADRYPGSALLVYDHDGTRLEAWLLGANGIVAFDQTTITLAKLDGMGDALRAGLAVDEDGSSRSMRRRASVAADRAATISWEDAAHEVARVLLPKPIASAIREFAHVVVVPVRGIGTIPFAALAPFGDGTTLNDHVSITVAPSLGDFSRTSRNMEQWSLPFTAPLVVGDPAYPQGAGWTFDAIPGARDEAVLVAKRLGTEPLIGARATEDAVRARARVSDVLYFATHGRADAQSPLDAGFLALAVGETSDGFWTPREVQGEDLRRAKLVVLSACQTGLGQTHDFGTIGLARAFQLAGVPRVLMSLWSVPDAGTYALMDHFTARIEHVPPAQALKESIQDVRKMGFGPATWAAFSLFGVPR